MGNLHPGPARPNSSLWPSHQPLAHSSPAPALPVPPPRRAPSRPSRPTQWTFLSRLPRFSIQTTLPPLDPSPSSPFSTAFPALDLWSCPSLRSMGVGALLPAASLLSRTRLGHGPFAPVDRPAERPSPTPHGIQVGVRLARPSANPTHLLPVWLGGKCLHLCLIFFLTTVGLMASPHGVSGGESEVTDS